MCETPWSVCKCEYVCVPTAVDQVGFQCRPVKSQVQLHRLVQVISRQHPLGPLLPIENCLFCLPGLSNSSTHSPIPALLITMTNPVPDDVTGSFLHICLSASLGPGEVIWWLVSVLTQHTFLLWSPDHSRGPMVEFKVTKLCHSPNQYLV